MSYDNDPNALASALPAGIDYDPKVTADSDVWTARRIAEFQAERLAESGYQLVYVGDSHIPHEHDWVSQRTFQDGLSDPQACSRCPATRVVREQVDKP